MILLIDNYDSFSYNLVQALANQGADVRVVRNDEIGVDDAVALGAGAVVVSPGPCTPAEAGISVELVKRVSGRVPVLGVCLGHQSIAAAFGVRILHAKKIMHGKTSMVRYGTTPLYAGITNPFEAGRYHSLAVTEADLPSALVADAWADDDELMGFHHVDHPTYAVQFHPESILTPDGDRLLGNFLKLADRK
jgi:anthranilate synthase component 2